MYKGKRLAITTGGDNPAVIKKNIDFAAKHKADILVTAAKTWGETHRLLNDFAKETGATIDKVKKAQAATDKEQQSLNEANVAKLQKKLEKLIAGKEE